MKFQLIIDLDKTERPFDGLDIATCLQHVAEQVNHILAAGLPGRSDDITVSKKNGYGGYTSIKIGRWSIIK